MGDVVRAVVGWVERVRGAGRLETQFVSAGVQGLMSGQRGRTRRPRIRREAWSPSNDFTQWRCCGYGKSGYGNRCADAWNRWRAELPWWRRWITPMAREPQRRGHVPPHAVPPPASRRGHVPPWPIYEPPRPVPPPSLLRKEHQAVPKP